MTDEPTTRELDRMLGQLRAHIDRGFDKIDARLDRMITAETFAAHQRSAEQRMAAIEAGLSAAETRWGASRDHLQAEIDQVEQGRATDRRMMIKATIAAAATLLAAVITIVAQLLTGGGFS